ncbi:MAG: hypothetical protein IKN84_00570, partial [Bacteroidales bacterium]|nr:hypothetical protein [Bacteroidales bacterium]
MKPRSIILACLLALTACSGQTAQRDSVADSINSIEADAKPVKTQTLVIDVEKLEPPKGPLAMVHYDKA